MGGGGEVATMLMETNLGTRICFTVPTDITIGELKKYFEKEHFSCLPDIGEIQVTAILVEEKPYFYHLPNSVDLNTVFPAITQPWRLRVKATPLLPQHHHHHQNNIEENRSERFHPCEHQSDKHEPTIDDAVKENLNSHQTSTQLEQHEDTIDAAVKQKGNYLESSTQNAVNGTPERRSRSFGDKSNATTNNSECVMPRSKVENVVSSVQGSQSKMSSTQVVSVTGLINKYFSGFNAITCSSDSDVTSRVVCSSEIEVQSTNRPQSCCSKRKIDATPHSTPKPSKRRMKKSLPQLTPKTPVDVVSKTSGSKNTRYIVGERLLSASKSFRGCMTERSPSLSVCRFNNDRDKSQVNGSIFSISDSDH